MTIESWDADQAVVQPDRDLDGGVDERPCSYRYGVTAWEASHHEPLDVSLDQERPDTVAGDMADDWVDVEAEDPFPGRLLADEDLRDDDYAVAVEDVDEFAVEELAMHLVDE